jgi:two-component system, OmpR family, sensor histidine kinase CiaH
MFEKARIKLTIWYLLIIMTISIFFSCLIYVGATREFDRVLTFGQYKLQHPETIERYIQRPVWEIETLPPRGSLDLRLAQVARLRAVEGLILINLIILFISSFAGYFLAGRTLRPIKKMIDEQNRFITDASHELNTPLTSLKTSIEVNLRDKNFTITKARELMLSNLEDINSLQNLSDKLIKLNQYQYINGSVLFAKVLLPEVLNKALEKVNKQAKEKKIKISVNILKTKLLGDEESLVELFVILLDNAIKYSKQNKIITVTNRKLDSKVQIEVKDQGVGITKEDLPFIFDRFYRAEKSRTKNDYPGYGLGLSIAKRIVSMHNGDIVVESEAGKGTKFIITLKAI